MCTERYTHTDAHTKRETHTQRQTHTERETKPKLQIHINTLRDTHILRER